LFQGGNDTRGEIAELPFGQGGVVALKCDVDEQGKLPWRDIPATKKVDRIDRDDFSNSQSRNHHAHGGEGGPVAEDEGEIAFHGRESRNWLVFPRFAT